jgi:hypothetical protein
LFDDQTFAEWFPNESTPTGALNRYGRLREVRSERIEASEVLVDRGGELGSSYGFMTAP